ncbi:MAG TPA: MSEP-CTERM sorting domain-containing protein [Hymenobacter sp.]
MHSLRKPQWVFLVNMAPVLLLLAFCYGEFSVVRTLLPVESVALWQRFGLALALLEAGGAGYAGRQWARREPLSAVYSLVVLLAYSLLLCWFTTSSSDLLPRDVPAWMVPTDPVLLAWTFLMPTLAHALLALVAKFTPEDHNQSALSNIAFAAAVPIGWVIIYVLLEGLVRLLPWPVLGEIVFAAAMVASTLGFFFFLVRAVFVMAMRRTGVWAETSVVWKGLLTIVLPVVGLAVNNGLAFGGVFGSSGGIFGNFTSPWFYVLAVLNGVLLCVPSGSRPLPRLLLLLGRSALFGYTFYFFLVFLPFLPLSIPAIILIGTGFLIMTPVLLFVVHVRQLSEDVAVVRAVYSQPMAVAALVAGLAALPLYVTFDYWHSRRVLHDALAYVYTPNYSEATRLDAAALEKTLAVVKQHKDRRWDFLSGSQLPYLSTYYNWLVLDNLMLADDKIADLERIFRGTPVRPAAAEPVFASRRDDAFGSATGLRGLAATSTYDARQQAWVSWVSLEIANANPNLPDGEYSTRFTLPPGCWVSDYYLTIGNRQERGILAEKKAAMWVFAQIRNERQSRDPGLLHYLGPHQIGLRVYPVMGAEPRHTRIQLLHKEPFVLTIEGQTVALGDAATAPPVATPVRTPGNGAVYLSGLAKKSLPLVQRRPYYHFLIDASANAGVTADQYQARIERQLAQALPSGAPARFSLVNAYAVPVAAGADWKQAFSSQPHEGGFFLTGAIRRVLFECQQRPGPTYPIMVVATDHLENAVLEEDFADFSSAYPESDLFYELNNDGQLVPHSLRQASARALGAVPRGAMPVRAWPDAAQPCAYLPDNEEAAVVPGRAMSPLQWEATGSRWLTGLALQGYQQWQSFHPESTDRERVPFIQASFRAGIMTPFTSFLALENDAQKAALFRKQEQTLAANASLDTLEKNELPQPQPTETPIDSGALVLLVGGGLLAGWYLRRNALLTA